MVWHRKGLVPELELPTLSTGAGVDLPAVLPLTDEVPQVTQAVGAVLGLLGLLGCHSHFSGPTVTDWKLDWALDCNQI